MRAALDLEIGGVALRVEAEPRVLEAARARYGAFVGPVTDDPLLLRVESAAQFSPELERDAHASAVADGAHAIALSGAARGWFDLEARRGVVEQVTGLGAVDSLLRAALSLAVPASGALLVHAALTPMGVDRAWVFAGASGAGKSTVADHLGGVCDECVVLRPRQDRVVALATPYWQGRPWSGACETVVCLRRAGSETPGCFTLTGAQAIRVLLGQVVRYASLERTERAILDVAAQLCAHTRVVDARCPVGDAYLPFVEALVRGQEAA